MSEQKEIVEKNPARVTRNMVVWLLGTPRKTEGSLNDPREQEEHGLRFNEKWIYAGLADDPAGATSRIVYWHRYDLAGTVVGDGNDGAWRPDQQLEKALRRERARAHQPDQPSAEAAQPGLKERERGMYQVSNRNPPITPTNEYRPVSQFEGTPDLGGYIQPKDVT